MEHKRMEELKMQEVEAYEFKLSEKQLKKGKHYCHAIYC